MNLGLRLALGAMGMPTKLIDDIEKALPASERLTAFYTANASKIKPDLDVVVPVLGEVISFFNKGE